jgi:phage terminase large subunit
MIRALKKRVHVIQGGTSAGKTFAVLPILIDKAIRHPNREISVVAESVPHLKRGAVRDFKKIMRFTQRWDETCWHDTDKRYTFKNGSYIEFFSPESILGARRTDLFVNEANNILFEDYHQLAIRTSGEIWIDYNPSAEFWAHTELIPDPDADFIILNYTHNEALSETIVREIEKARDKTDDPYWANWWRVYGLGEVGTLEGVIFGSFTNCSEFPNNCDWVGYGMDFGYSNDPTTLIKIGMKQGEIFLQQLIYQTGLTNTDLIAEMKLHKIGTHEIVADSADPKSIEELRRAGFNIKGAAKGADSIMNGIDTMKRYKFNIVSSSLDLIKEWRSYSWKKNNATNKFENTPVDTNNHAIDAIRYLMQYKILPTGRTRFMTTQ